MATVLSSYDSRDLLVDLAALQLLPDNARSLGRLEVAATLVAGLPHSGPAPAVSVGRLRTTLNSPPFSTDFLSEDAPLDELFAEPLGFIGGSYLVSPGVHREGVYIFERLLGAIFFSGSPFPNADFTSEARDLIGASLRLSDQILSGAGVKRYQTADRSAGGNIATGAPGRLSTLKGLLEFSDIELSRRLRPWPPDALAPLATALGDVAFPDGFEAGGPLARQPIVRTGDGYVVAAPLSLLGAARHAVLVLAVQRGSAGELVERFRRAVRADVADSLEKMGMVEESLPPVPAANLPLEELLFQMDEDKLLYVQVVTDDLSGYSAEAVYGTWNPPSLSDRLETRRRRVERALSAQSQRPRSVMRLVVQQMLGRYSGVRIGSSEEGLVLGLSGADLRVLAALDGVNAVTLWKYAKNRQAAAPPVNPLTAQDQLGTYAMYRENGHSMRLDYATSSKPDEYLGRGLDLRAAAAQRNDSHPQQYDVTRGVMVRRWYAEEASDPIYVADPPPDLSIPFLVEGLPAPVWVFGPDPTDAEDAEANHHFTYMVAFWLWQMTDVLGPPLSPTSRPAPPVHVHLDLGDRARFRPAEEIENPTDFGAVSVSNDSIHVRLGDGNWSELRRNDNQGERNVMRLVAIGIRELAEARGARDVLSDGEIDAVLHHNFDNPRRKHLLLLPPTNPALTPARGLPYRRVQAPDRTEVMYQLGHAVQVQLGLNRGVVPPPRRMEVLGTARDWCLAEIERAVAELSPQGLLERLMALDEGLSYARAISRLKMPTRLACYESSEEMQQRLLREQPEMNLAAIAYRFLIEYATAVPPTGSAKVSTTAIDWLVALVAEMVNVAMVLDSLATGLADPTVSFNEHDELVSDASNPYIRAQASFLETFTREHIARAEDAFSSYWDAPEPAPTLLEPEVVDLDAAMVHETGGTSVMEMRAFVEATTEIGLDLGDNPNVMKRDELENQLATRLGWPAGKVASAIDFLLLQPRGTFYSTATPAAWSNGDVQPWRFNRRLSYLRRPLLARDTPDGVQVLWGTRNLWEAWPLQLSYLKSSKFKPTSTQLRQLLGRIANQRGKEFEHKVGDLYDGQSRYRVLRGRDKFNRKPVSRPNGDALGDIDVLVADESEKQLAAVEAKDITMAFTPSELAEELGTYFETDGQAKHAAAMDRHAERLAWLQAHVADVLVTFGLPAGDASDWTVEGLFVTDEPVSSPHIIRPAMPILSYRELEARLENPPKKRRPVQRKTRARRS